MLAPGHLASYGHSNASFTLCIEQYKLQFLWQTSVKVRGCGMYGNVYRKCCITFWPYRIILNWYCLIHGPGSSVGIATQLRAERSGHQIPGGRDFLPVQTGPGGHPASCTIGTGSFPGGKVRPRRAADHSLPSSAAVMEE